MKKEPTFADKAKKAGDAAVKAILEGMTPSPFSKKPKPPTKKIKSLAELPGILPEK